MSQHDQETSRGVTWRLDWGQGPFPCSTQRAQMRRAIVEEPNDETLRQVYADLAIEEGDPHGELIRLATLLDQRQANLGALETRASSYMPELETHPELRDLSVAVLSLRARYGYSFDVELFSSEKIGRRFFGRCHTSRGFVSRANTPTDEQLLFLAARTPLSELNISPQERYAYMPPGVQVLRNWPSLETLDLCEPGQLVALHQGGDDPELPARLRHPAAHDVRRLVVHHARDDHELDRAFAHHPQLESLELNNVPRCDAISELPQLTSLTLPQVFDAKVLDRLPLLRELTIARAREMDLAAIGAHIRDAGLTALQVGAYDDADGMAKLLAELNGARSLRVLRLRGPVRTDSLKALATIDLPALTTLELFCTEDAPMQLPFPNLHTLDLTVVDGHFDGLADAPFWKGLRTFMCSVDSPAPSAIRGMLRTPAPQLSSFTFTGSSGDEEPDLGHVFREWVGLMPALTDLHVEGVSFLDVIYAAAEEAHLGGLLHLHAGWNADEAIHAFLRSKNTKSIRSLALQDIREETAQALLESELPELGRLQLNGYRLSHRTLDALERRFGHRIARFLEQRVDGALPEPTRDPYWDAGAQRSYR